MARPSQEAKILEVALECFAQYGYDGTRIRQIAQGAGVTEGALYRHYPSKEALAQSLFHHHMNKFSISLQNAANSETADTVEQQLRAMIKIGLQNYRENPAAFNFVLLRPPGFNPNLPTDFIYPVEVVESVIKRGQASGFIRQGQPNLLAEVFLGCLLRPIIVSLGAAPGALDLIEETKHDQVIEAAAIAALKSDNSQSA